MRKLLILLIGILLSINVISQTCVIDSLKNLLQNEDRDSVRTRLLSKLGTSYINLDPDTALKYAQQGLALANARQDAYLQNVAFNALANVFYSTGDYAKALEYYFESLKKAEMINNQTAISIALSNTGTVGQAGKGSRNKRHQVGLINCRQWYLS